MQLLQAIILGIVQGLTEFIPVSSSGHLIIADKLLGFRAGGLVFDLALHLGTLAALLLYFGRDIKLMLVGENGRRDSRLLRAIAIATLPAVVAGVLLQGLAEQALRSTHLVAVNLIWVGVLMWWVDRRSRGRKELDRLTSVRSLGIGLAQAVALIPGVSRSGATITAGLASGFDRVAATRFSFLISAPVIAGAIAKVLLQPENLQQVFAHLGVFLVGALAAFASGYLAIKFMLQYLAKRGLAVFAYYRVVLGVLVLLLT
jgi:undecaprenyl-diphosphatase